VWLAGEGPAAEAHFVRRHERLTLARLIRRILLCLLLLPCSGCFAARPLYNEPRWGNAPPPVPAEITEITRDHLVCTRGARCQSERVVFRRDGLARREFTTGHNSDSLFFANVDSAQFRWLAQQLIAGNLFGEGDDEGHHEPLANESYVISAATLCRRRTVTIGGMILQLGRLSAVRLAIDSVTGAVTWNRPQM
jgi:hypothetical protein